MAEEEEKVCRLCRLAGGFARLVFERSMSDLIPNADCTG